MKVAGTVKEEMKKWDISGTMGNECGGFSTLHLLIIIIPSFAPVAVLLAVSASSLRYDILIQPFLCRWLRKQTSIIQNFPIRAFPRLRFLRARAPLQLRSAWVTRETASYWLRQTIIHIIRPIVAQDGAINDGSSRPWRGHDGGIRTAVGGGDVTKEEEDVWACCRQAWDVDDKWPALVPHQADVCVIRAAVSDWIMWLQKGSAGIKGPFYVEYFFFSCMDLKDLLV